MSAGPWTALCWCITSNPIYRAVQDICFIVAKMDSAPSFWKAVSSPRFSWYSGISQFSRIHIASNCSAKTKGPQTTLGCWKHAKRICLCAIFDVLDWIGDCFMLQIVVFCFLNLLSHTWKVAPSLSTGLWRIASSKLCWCFVTRIQTVIMA